MKSIYLKISIITLFFTFSFVNAQQSVDLVRYYSYNTKQHFYTTKNDAPPGYVYEGVLTYVFAGQYSPSSSPIFLLYKNGDRLMTTSVAEKNNVLSMGYTDGGIIGYTTYPPYQSTAIYRYFNGSKPDRFYTNNYNELGAGNAGYGYEGLAGF